MKPDVTRLIDFQEFLLQFSNIERVLHRKRSSKIIPENDTEHSYDLAMTAWFLSQWFPELDRDRVIRYALIHDLVEIHAGDTYAFASDEKLASKADREAKALKQLCADWPDFPGLTEDIETFKSLKSAEAKFVYALDKIMPMLINYLHNGYSWKQNNVTAEMVYKVKIPKVSKSPEILPYFEELYELLLKHPEILTTR